MIGELFTTGIEIKQLHQNNKWTAIVNFGDEGVHHGIQGNLSNKNYDDLLAACRTVLEDSRKMGITMLKLPDKRNKLYVTELALNTPETWEQIHWAAVALEFDVCDCINRNDE